MKTKLTLNIEDRVVENAKKVSSKRGVSLSALVESYLDSISKTRGDLKDKKKTKSITEKIKELTKKVSLTDENVKLERGKYLEKKYGK